MVFNGGRPVPPQSPMFPRLKASISAYRFAARKMQGQKGKLRHDATASRSHEAVAVSAGHGLVELRRVGTDAVLHSRTVSTSTRQHEDHLLDAPHGI